MDSQALFIEIKFLETIYILKCTLDWGNFDSFVISHSDKNQTFKILL